MCFWKGFSLKIAGNCSLGVDHNPIKNDFDFVQTFTLNVRTQSTGTFINSSCLSNREQSAGLSQAFFCFPAHAALTLMQWKNSLSTAGCVFKGAYGLACL